MNQVAKAVMPGMMPRMFGMPKFPVGKPIIFIFMLVLPTGANSRRLWRLLVIMSMPQNVKKMVTSMPLPRGRPNPSPAPGRPCPDRPSSR